MNTQEAIERLSSALRAASSEPMNKEAIRSLTQDLTDQKHTALIEKGLYTNDKTLVIHGIMGALSHYEAEKEHEEKREHLAWRH